MCDFVHHVEGLLRLGAAEQHCWAASVLLPQGGDGEDVRRTPVTASD